MLGLDESALFREIDTGCFGIANISMNIPPQSSLSPSDILTKLATGIAKAIEANNREIESQLRSQDRL
jgi:hypothetical protein